MSILSRINLRSGSRFLPVFRHSKQNHSIAANDEYTETPLYPPILDMSFKGKKMRKKAEWHDEIRNLTTVEEKLMKLNMPRYYGWKSVLLYENLIPYNSELFAQYVTRTHIVKELGLPKYYDRMVEPEKLDAILNMVKNEIQDVILFERNCRRYQEKFNSDNVEDPSKMDDMVGQAVIQQINRILLANLSSNYSHLLETQIDFEPRIECFWFAGGIDPSKYVRKSKEGLSWYKPYANEPVDRCIQYKGDPVLQLRHDFPLSEIITLSESENPAFEVPQFKYDPRVLGYETQHCHARNVPGFWPDDPSQFGILSYHKRGHIIKRPVEHNDAEHALHVQAILASYAWLLTQAYYQGFSTVTELTYPLLTQTVITNGQSWSLYAYQLNTTLQHSEHADENPRRNVCWSTGTLKLYEDIEDGKLIGFNDDVLKELIKFYINAPQEKQGVEMKPYLGTNARVISDIEDPEKRAWLDRYYKHMVTHRPRHLLMQTPDSWEKIYKIDNPSKLFDKKRKLYEFGINRMNRKYNEHKSKYVPKALRPPGSKRVMKWEKTYYP